VTIIELAAFVGQLPQPALRAGLCESGSSRSDEQPVPAEKTYATSSRPGLKESGSVPFAVDGTPGGCPFQVEGLCSVHAIRPFGCRVFFCDATSDDWQHGQYERFHADLKRLHAQLGVPYQYLEWRQALAALDLMPPPAPPDPPADPSKRLSLPQLRL
jgi:Fe-S-cluster containining protein